MIALDTNCLLRLLTNDLPEHARRVVERLERCEASSESVFISVPVLIETIGNLARRRYRFTRDQIATVVERLLATPVLVMHERDAVAAALADYRHGWGDFADHLIRRISQAAGADSVVTFDGELLGHPGFQAP